MLALDVFFMIIPFRGRLRNNVIHFNNPFESDQICNSSINGICLSCVGNVDSRSFVMTVRTQWQCVVC